MHPAVFRSQGNTWERRCVGSRRVEPEGRRCRACQEGVWARPRGLAVVLGVMLPDAVTGAEERAERSDLQTAP